MELVRLRPSRRVPICKGALCDKDLGPKDPQWHPSQFECIGEQLRTLAVFRLGTKQLVLCFSPTNKYSRPDSDMSFTRTTTTTTPPGTMKLDPRLPPIPTSPTSTSPDSSPTSPRQSLPLSSNKVNSVEEQENDKIDGFLGRIAKGKGYFSGDMDECEERSRAVLASEGSQAQEVEVTMKFREGAEEELVFG